MKKFNKRIFFFLVSMVAVVALLSSCDKGDETSIIPSREGHAPDEQSASVPDAEFANLRAGSGYFTLPAVGVAVPNSSLNLRGAGSVIYHGGAISAMILAQNGSRFRIRIFKQDRGAFRNAGTAMIVKGGLNNDVLRRKYYSSGERYIDIDVSVSLAQGYLHLYAITRDEVNQYYFYAEPILVYTAPLCKVKKEYTADEILGTANGVEVKASDTDNLSYNGPNQCTAFCIEYYKQVYSRKYPHFYYAGRWYGDTHNFPDLVRYKNGGSMAPRPGDILCLSGGKGNYGHVAIVMDVNQRYVKIAHQNTGIPAQVWQYPIGGRLARNGNTLTPPSGYQVQGWMRCSPD